ncbi:oxidoreductase, short chain dehydrogenase/reductase family protein [Leptospira inadai serovar Lyme str. 10]|uniref:Oxidoreductase, short chain dehydrogenase/reductase family protein n=2 Tax=Leptospira inadai serovar Lyme TaxID=293084 RepID=V6H9Z2_9LEPT|nr:SDR family oxidoreductase [Leptospira inadai]EQA35872.1 oxidoreductase, short chain dehydrogenase/reductase family protein [Leptospira inadai serovar Lyme str. 10]PNV76839.1 short-chain dehydrogenase [Leptospira inadai serovar Lyme]
MKHAVITGGTEGIGKATVSGLADRGWAVTMVVRNPAKAENTISEIRSKTGNQNLDFVTCDLSSLASVASAAADLRKKIPKIDALINNAGLMSLERKISKEGYELNFAVNHLSHALLTEMLLSNIKAATQGRVISVSSKLYRNAKPDPDDLSKEKSYGWMGAYADSKLYNIFFAQDLADRLKGTQVTANALHPGVVKTELARDLKGPLGFIFSGIKNLFFITPEKGAQTSIYLADAPGLETVSGQYFEDRKQVKLGGPALNSELREKIREETRKIISRFM